MKKNLSALMMTAVLCSTLVPVPAFAAGTFSDVPASHPNADAIAYVQAQGIVSGYADGTFKPDNTINRAEFTKIVMGATSPTEKILACDMKQGGLLTGFIKDIPAGAWFTPYVCYALLSEVVYGYPDGTFKPNQTINFAEATKIISNAVFGPGAGDSNPWYKQYVESLAGKHAIPTTIRSFEQTVTRGEMAEMIYRIKTGNLNKPSQTYELIASGKTAAASSPANSSQAGTAPGNATLLATLDFGEKENAYSVFNSHLGVDADGKTVIYTRKAEGGWKVVINGKAGATFTDVNTFYIIKNGHVAYLADNITDTTISRYVVIDGKESLIFSQPRTTDALRAMGLLPSTISLSDTGGHFAYNPLRVETLDEAKSHFMTNPQCQASPKALEDCMKAFGYTEEMIPRDYVSKLVIDGKDTGKEYHTVSNVEFGPDGKDHAYVASPLSDRNKSYLYKNGVMVREVSSACGGISYHFGSKTLLCYGQSSNTWVYHDMAAEERPYSQLETPYMNADGSIYVITQYNDRGSPAGESLTINGKTQPTVMRITNLVMSPDFKHAAYAADIYPEPGKASDRYGMTYDGGHQGKTYDQIYAPIFSTDGKKIAYIAVPNTDLGPYEKRVTLLVTRMGPDGAERETEIDGTFVGGLSFLADGSIRYAIAKDGKVWLVTGKW